jgi:hypothetical protein
MKKGWMPRGFLLLAALVLAAAVLFGCAAQKGAQYSYGGDSSPSAPAENAGDSAGMGSQEVTGIAGMGAASDSQKLIYIGEMEIESEQFEADYAALKEQVSAMGGYLAGETLSGTAPVAYGDAGRYGELVARIPTEHFQAFLDDTDGRMDIVRRHVDVQDITEYYYDNETRITLLETRYAKLEEHLRSAERMEDIIALEQEMSEILSELDELKGTRRHLDHQVEYSTLTIEVREVVRSSGVAASRKGVGSRMGEAFNGTLRAIGVFFENAAVFLVGALPLLLILAVIALAVLLCMRAGKKRRAKKLPSQKESAEK